ncbi:MAG: hypothetical protein R3B84_12505 [Zavarzinella sp.]
MQNPERLESPGDRKVEQLLQRLQPQPPAIDAAEVAYLAGWNVGARGRNLWMYWSLAATVASIVFAGLYWQQSPQVITVEVVREIERPAVPLPPTVPEPHQPAPSQSGTEVVAANLDLSEWRLPPGIAPNLQARDAILRWGIDYFPSSRVSDSGVSSIDAEAPPGFFTFPRLNDKQEQENER